MRSENTKKLFNDFPSMFRGHDKGDYRRTLMGFGFSCDDGWFNLIHNLCRAIQNRIDKGEEREDFIVLQVKEKFAGLRFYTGGCYRETYDLIDKATKESYKICELCSKEGTMHVSDSGWFKTLCSDCATKSGRYKKYEK